MQNSKSSKLENFRLVATLAFTDPRIWNLKISSKEWIRILIHRLHRRASIFNANIQGSRFFDYEWVAVVQKFSHSSIHASLENEDIVDDNDMNVCKSLPWAIIIWPCLLGILPFITPNDSELSTCCTTTARVELAMMTFLCNEGCLSLLKILSLQFQQEFHLVFSTRLRGCFNCCCCFTDACTLYVLKRGRRRRRRGSFTCE